MCVFDACRMVVLTVMSATLLTCVFSVINLATRAVSLGGAAAADATAARAEARRRVDNMSLEDGREWEIV